MELLVALVIIGTIVAGVSLAIPDPAADKAREEVQRMTALLGLAREEAILQSRELGVGFWEDGYGFYELSDMVDEDGERLWAKLEDDLLRRRTLPPDMEIELELEGRDIVMKAVPVEKPQVFLLSSGEVSPFTATLSYREEIEFELTADALGNIEFENVTDTDYQ
jgi:general secretion pathway protein H